MVRGGERGEAVAGDEFDAEPLTGGLERIGCVGIHRAGSP